MKDIAIFGYGGFGREVLVMLNQYNDKLKSHFAHYDFIGFFDDTKKHPAVRGGMADLNAYPDPLAIALSIGDSKARSLVRSAITNKYIDYPTIVHPSVIKGDDVYIGQGSIICAGNILTTNVRIGRHVIVNLSCTVGHDVVLDDFVSIMPGVSVSGNVYIKQCAYIGTGAVILPGITIGKGAVIGAGAVVTKDVPDGETWVGVPARQVVSQGKIF